MSAAYAFVLASLILERLVDPLIVIPAIAAGLVCKRRLHVAAAAAAIAVACEMARYVSNFNVAQLALSWASAAAWGSLAYVLRQQLRGQALSGKDPWR